MKVLVTGGTGFLGQHLACRLLQLGHDVTAIGRNRAAGEKLQRAGITFHEVDITDSQKVLESFAGQEIVFHCAALSSPWGNYTDFYASNVQGTKHVIAACKAHNIKRLIHVSTPSLYFSFDERRNVREDAALPQKFVNHYARTKQLAEQEIDQAWAEGLPVITIRPRAIFGPGDTAIIPRLIKANETGFIPMIKDRQVEMDLTYVDNVVDALLLCMESAERTLGQKYNITNGETIELKEVLNTLFTGIGQPFRQKTFSYRVVFWLAKFLEWQARHLKGGAEPVLTRYTVSVLANSQTLNIDKARRELGYNPRVSIDEGMERFTKWWEEEHGH